MAPQQGGSGLTGALGNAVQAACVDLVRTFLDRVSGDEVSPLRGCRLEGITVRDGGIQVTDDPGRFDTYADILTRHGLNEITIAGKTGTAEAGGGKPDHAWFAGYVPADKPKIAFVVVLENAGSGGHAAGPVAREFVQALLALGLLERRPSAPGAN